MSRPPLRVFSPGLILVAAVFSILFPTALRAQFSTPGPATVHSVSGQFVVVSSAQFSPLMHDPDLATNANFIRLDPALLAVSAERFKTSVYGLLGLPLDSSWTGKIFLTLHPAFSIDEAATLTVGEYLGSWSCRVEMPDIAALPHYGRALSAALLLELAGRNQKDPSRVPEIPSWLADGLAQMAFARDLEKIDLSLPGKTVNGVSLTGLNESERGLDPEKAARVILQNSPALTFDNLCWPTDAQTSGRDGGVYLASAQVFTSELLALPDGQKKMCDFLNVLPAYYNWQTAFFQAFHDDFKYSLEVEKWWSLRVVRFASRDPGPHWTADVSRDRLASLLTVAVDYRSTSNSLPEHMQVSLQSAVENFSSDERDDVLGTKLRDLRVAQLRLIQPYGALAGGYADALADFLGEGKPLKPTAINKHVELLRPTASVVDTVRRLDLLDARRRDIESHKVTVPGQPAPGNLNPNRQPPVNH